MESNIRFVIMRVIIQNRTTAKRESDLLIISMIAMVIGLSGVHLPINQNYNKI